MNTQWSEKRTFFSRGTEEIRRTFHKTVAQFVVLSVVHTVAAYFYLNFTIASLAIVVAAAVIEFERTFSQIPTLSMPTNPKHLCFFAWKGTTNKANSCKRSLPELREELSVFLP